MASRNIQVDSPYEISRAPDELHYTYLDTFGRPVIVAHKKNLVEQHIQDMVVCAPQPCLPGLLPGQWLQGQGLAILSSLPGVVWAQLPLGAGVGQMAGAVRTVVGLARPLRPQVSESGWTCVSACVPGSPQVHYTFNKVLMLQEPLLVVAAFYVLFFTVIVYVRLDFSITKVPNSAVCSACLTRFPSARPRDIRLCPARGLS